MTVILTGFMGCGKSSVGRHLASLLHCRFTDLDEYISAAAGCSIPEIFASEGEESFRRRELEALRECLGDAIPADAAQTEQGPPDTGTVISLGGGTPARPEVAALIRGTGALCVFLRAKVSTLRRNLGPAASRHRPMLRTHDLEELLAARTPIYESLADIVLDIDGLSVQEVAQILAAEILHRG